MRGLRGRRGCLQSYQTADNVKDLVRDRGIMLFSEWQYEDWELGQWTNKWFSFPHQPTVIAHWGRCVRSSLTSQDIGGACQGPGSQSEPLFNYPQCVSPGLSPPLRLPIVLTSEGVSIIRQAAGTSLLTPFHYFIIKEAIIFCLQNLSSCCFQALD